MKFTETFHPIYVIEPKDYGSAGIDGESIDMSLLNRVAIEIDFGAITGNSILKFYAGATPGTKTTALAFSYRFADADYKVAGGDGLGDATAVASTGLTLTAATFDHRRVIVEFENNAMPDGKKWLVTEIDATATVMLASANAWGDPRYAANDGPTVVDPA